MIEGMYEDIFPVRLTQLRINKGVSARDMSLSIGQNAGYINNIESGKSLPSMTGFFYICEYLNISPQEFFETDCSQPEEVHDLIKDLKRLNRRQLQNISSIVQDLVHANQNKIV